MQLSCQNGSKARAEKLMSTCHIVSHFGINSTAAAFCTAAASLSHAQCHHAQRTIPCSPNSSLQCMPCHTMELTTNMTTVLLHSVTVLVPLLVVCVFIPNPLLSVALDDVVPTY